MRQTTLKVLLAALVAMFITSVTAIPFVYSLIGVLLIGCAIGSLPLEHMLNSTMFPIFESGRKSIRVSSRFARYGYACYKDDGNPERVQLLQEIQAKISEGLNTRMTKEQVDTAIAEKMKLFDGVSLDGLRSMLKEDTGVMATIRTMSTQIEELRNANKPKLEDMSIRGQVAKWIETNKATIESIRSGKRVELPNLELRVASPMTPATVDSGSSAYVKRYYQEPGVNDIPRFALTFWNYLRKGRTNAENYIWVNKTNPLGAAGFIGPGVAKPGISFELVSENSHAKKVAVSAKAATELLQDIDGMTTMIEDELSYQLDLETNSKLMTGTASSTVPAGIQSLSLAYSAFTNAAAIKTTNPNYMDAIRAAVGQLRSGKLAGRIVAFINPLDAANMDLAKATSSGVYLLPPFTTPDGRNIGGAEIVEDNNITVGNLQIGFIDYYKVLIYKDFTISVGWENDDFTKNLQTWVAERRIHQIFNTQYTGAFMYDTFANIITAITAA